MSRIAPSTRDPVSPEKRKAMTPKRRLKIWTASNGLCWLCGKLVRFEEAELDHKIALINGGSDGDDNIAPAHPNCHRAKYGSDIATGSKIKRLLKREAGIKKPSRLKSRGFDKTLRKKMDGTVERRDQ
jgi:5-methylcytosine-specific restriction endonuclease McrA